MTSGNPSSSSPPHPASLRVLSSFRGLSTGCPVSQSVGWLVGRSLASALDKLIEMGRVCFRTTNSARLALISLFGESVCARASVVTPRCSVEVSARIVQ